MIPVRIKLPLKIRSGAGTSFDIIGIAPASGKVIDMDGVKDDGASWKGISKWYFKVNDKNEQQWYWAGRIEEVVEEQPVGAPGNQSVGNVSPVNFNAYVKERVNNNTRLGVINDMGTVLKSNIDYSLLLNLDEGIKNLKGEGVTVAVMDHPIGKGLRFKNDVIRPFDAGNPIDAHGNMIAGIIAGISDIIGIAPNVTLVELPIRDSTGKPRESSVILQMIDFLKSLKPPVILNVSQFLSDEFLDSFRNIKNAIIVAASGNDGVLTEDELKFPSSLDNAISVGCVSKEFSTRTINSKINFAFPSFDYVSYSTGLKKLETRSDTSSFSTAVMTSIIALLASNGKISNDINAVRQAIASVSLPYSNLSNYDFLNSLNPLK